jgi:Ricin-type beta-trefoil lectin domain-like
MRMRRMLVNAVVAVSAAGLSTPAHAGPGELFTLTAVHSGKCLQIQGASVEPFAQAQQATCTGAANQQLSFDRVTGRLVMAHSGMCLEVSTTVFFANGAPIWQAPCQDGNAAQLFTPSGPLTDGQTVAITAGEGGTDVGLCLDVASDQAFGGPASTADGASVVQWPCSNDSPSQQWQVTAAR